MFSNRLNDMANAVKDLVAGGDNEHLEYLRGLEDNIILQSTALQKRREALDLREEQVRTSEEKFHTAEQAFKDDLTKLTPELTEYVEMLRQEHDSTVRELHERLQTEVDRTHRNYAAKLGKLSSDHHDRLHQLEKEQEEIVANYHAEQAELDEQLDEADATLEENKQSLVKVQEEHRLITGSYNFVAHEIARANARLSEVQNEIEALRNKRTELTKYTFAELDKLSTKTLVVKVGRTTFEVSTALLRKHPKTLLGMIATDTVLKKNKQLKSGEVFFDEDPDMFPYVLEALRSNEVNFPHSVSDHLHMRRLSNSLNYFRVQPDVVNFVDDCLPVDYDSTLHALKFSDKSDFEGHLHRLFVQSTLNHFLTTPKEYNNTPVTVTGARTVIVTATLGNRPFVKAVDPRKFAGYTTKTPLMGRINSLAVHDEERFTTHVDVTDSFSKFFTFGDNNTLSDEDCTRLEFPSGVTLSGVNVCLLSTDTHTNWTMRFQTKSTTVDLSDDDYRWYLTSKALPEEAEEPLSF